MREPLCQRCFEYIKIGDGVIFGVHYRIDIVLDIEERIGENITIFFDTCMNMNHHKRAS